MVAFALIVAVLAMCQAALKAIAAGIEPSLPNIATKLIELIFLMLLTCLGFRFLTVLPGVAIGVGLKPMLQATNGNWPRLLLLSVICNALWPPLFLGFSLLLAIPSRQMPFSSLQLLLRDLVMLGFLAVFCLIALSVLTNLYLLSASRSALP